MHFRATARIAAVLAKPGICGYKGTDGRFLDLSYARSASVRHRRARRAGVLLAGALALCWLGVVGVSTASAAPGYRMAFASTVDNAASGGPLIIKGHRASHRRSDDGRPDHRALRRQPDEPRLNIGEPLESTRQYPDSLSHRHWHYKAFVRYQLRATSAGLPIVRPDNKAGFCLDRPKIYAPDFCGSLKPEALSVDEGLGPGTTDYYNPNLEGQYIDIAGRAARRLLAPPLGELRQGDLRERLREQRGRGQDCAMAERLRRRSLLHAEGGRGTVPTALHRP